MMFGTILTFLIVLSVLVIAHEWGHFICARRSGVTVEEFGFGFPPRLFGKKKGDTLYSVNLIPLGGFVRLKGENGQDRNASDSFANAPLWRRALILSGGVIMNMILAWALLSVGSVVGVPAVIDESIPSYARVTEEALHIATVLPDSPATDAGLMSGDTVVSINNTPVSTVDAFIEQSSGSDPLTVTVMRQHERIELSVIPAYIPQADRVAIGVHLAQTGLVHIPIYLAPFHGLTTTIRFTGDILSAFGSVIGELVTGRRPSVELSGPIGIAVVTGEVARLGFRYLLQFTALLSINLAIINILPIPALDGGRLLFLIIERIRGRAVNAQFEVITHNIGFILLMVLVLIVTYGDILRFGDRMLRAITAPFSG